jgi:hypothetical protein
VRIVMPNDPLDPRNGLSMGQVVSASTVRPPPPAMHFGLIAKRFEL